jgi:two-component system nitrate/nitrite response regulator NarL
MRTSPAVVAIDSSVETGPPQIDEVIRTLVELIEKISGEPTLGPCSAASSSEEVLVDTEVDGIRYLLVRMPRPNGKRIQLSPREQEIVRMVAKGHPNKVIADVLSISSWTVCTHLRRIFAKLGVGSRAAMVAQLLEIGALTADHRVTPPVR